MWNWGSWTLSGHMQLCQGENQLPKSECPGHECFWLLLYAVDQLHSRYLAPFSHAEETWEEDGSGSKSFLPDGRADKPERGSIPGKPLNLSPILDK